MLWILFGILLFKLISSEYYVKNNCLGFGGNKLYEISCQNITEFPQDLPKSTGHLSISCKRTSIIYNGVNQTATSNQSQSLKLNEDHLKYLRYLISLKITDCPIEELPAKLFQNNPHIQSVMLINLPLKRLKNVFHGTTNLLELHLSNLPQLEHIDTKLLVNQYRFSRLTLNNCKGLPTQNIFSTLLTVTKSIKEFQWDNSNVNPPIYLMEKSFSKFKFGYFTMRYNRVVNWQFFCYLKVGKIDISHSLSSEEDNFDLCEYSYFRRYLKYANLQSINLKGKFPKTICHSLVFVKSLSLNNNKITSLDDNIDKMFPSLEFLDISYNKIVNLQSNLEMIFFIIRRLKLANNPLHCNCQLKWLFSRYKFKIEDYPQCYYGFKKPKNNFQVDSPANLNETLRNIYFSELSSDSLICIAPQSPVLSLLDRFSENNQLVKTFQQKPHSQNSNFRNYSRSNNSTLYRIHSSNDRIGKEYTLVLNSDSSNQIALACETQGDPTPTLTWTNQSGNVIIKKLPAPSSSFTNKATLDINTESVTAGDPNPVYICTATNIEGVSFALINIQINRSSWHKLEPIYLSRLSGKSATSSALSPYFTIFIACILHFIQYFCINHCSPVFLSI